jgi:aminoglycoside phosphotransferase (APT) family kinase protein
MSERVGGSAKVTHFGEDIQSAFRDRICAQLALWLPAETVAEAKVRTLPGGAVNRNFLIDVGDALVLRLAPPPETRSDIGIDMANSATVATIAGQAGVGPLVLGVDEATGDSLIQYVPGVLNVNTIRDDEVLARVGAAVRRLHELPAEGIRRVSAFVEIEEWLGNAVGRGAQIPDGAPQMWELLDRCRSILGNVEGECLSHRDLNPQNCIYTDGAVKLIDWDFSGVDSPYLDMAMLATYAQLDDSQLDVFLDAAISDRQPADLARVQLMRFVHALREWAWCLSASDTLVDQTDAETALLPTEANAEGNFYDGYREVNWRFAERLPNDPRWESWLEEAASSLPAPGFRWATQAPDRVRPLSEVTA